MWRNKEKYLPTENWKNLADAQGTTQNQQKKKNMLYCKKDWHHNFIEKENNYDYFLKINVLLKSVNSHAPERRSITNLFQIAIKQKLTDSNGIQSHQQHWFPILSTEFCIS